MPTRVIIRSSTCQLFVAMHAQVQAAALGALPRLPHYRLAAALGEGEAEGKLGGRVLPCLQSSTKEVARPCIDRNSCADMRGRCTCAWTQRSRWQKEIRPLAQCSFCRQPLQQRPVRTAFAALTCRQTRCAGQLLRHLTGAQMPTCPLS